MKPWFGRYGRVVAPRMIMAQVIMWYPSLVVAIQGSPTQDAVPTHSKTGVSRPIANNEVGGLFD